MGWCMTYSLTLPVAIHRTIAPFHALHATQRILKRLRAFSSIHWLRAFSAYSMAPRGSSSLPSRISSIRGMAGRWGRPIPALDPLQPTWDMARKILKNKSHLVVDSRTPIRYPPCRSCVAVRGAGSSGSLTTEERPNASAKMHACMWHVPDFTSADLVPRRDGFNGSMHARHVGIEQQSPTAHYSTAHTVR